MSTTLRSCGFVLAAALIAPLAGCGNKGPLVMPQKPVPVETQPVPEAPASEPIPTESTPTDSTQTEPTQTEPTSDDRVGPTEADTPPTDSRQR